MKNRKINVLVTGVGGNIGQGIMKALRMSKVKTSVIGTDMNPLSVGFFRCDRAYVVKGCHEKGFLNQMVAIIRREKIHIVMVGSDTELVFFADHKAHIERATGCFVLVSAPKISRIGYDKWKTYQFCKSNGIPYPETYLPKQRREVKRFLHKKGFPIIVKPRVGYGSRGVHVILNAKELKFFATYVPHAVIQEYLGSQDEEYTAASFVTQSKEIAGTIIFRRYLSSGATYKAEVIYDVLLKKQIEDIITKIAPLGPCNIQFRKVNGKVIPFEFNIRFSGTTPMRSQFGFNDVEMALRHFIFKERLHSPKIKKGIAFRYWNEIFVMDAGFQKLNRCKAHAKGQFNVCGRNVF